MDEHGFQICPFSEVVGGDGEMLAEVSQGLSGFHKGNTDHCTKTESRGREVVPQKETWVLLGKCKERQASELVKRALHSQKQERDFQGRNSIKKPRARTQGSDVSPGQQQDKENTEEKGHFSNIRFSVFHQ